MDVTEAFINLGISLGLGLLVGLQRERGEKQVAGFRTFPMITILGTLSALLAEELGGGIVGASLLGVIAASFLGNLVRAREARQPGATVTPGAGITTEMAILVMFGVGAFLVVGPREIAVAIGAGVAVLLQMKETLHGFAARLGEKDMRAIMQFALISLVILPVLPNETYGPFDVLNPRRIWLVVVLVVAISLGGYVAYKLLGRDTRLVLGGLLGGMISSTATTVSYARQAVQGSPAGPALIIVLASSVTYVRVLIEVSVVAPAHLRAIAPPIVIMLLVSLLVSLVMWTFARRAEEQLHEQENPTELKAAIIFGLMYAIVLVAVAAAHEHLDRGGIFAVAALSGLTDMDAITLSTASMLDEGRLDVATTWRAIVIGIIANYVFKAGIVAALGTRGLLVRVAAAFAVSVAAGGLLLALWRTQAMW